MLFDGINVLRTGKFFGPETPGPWRHIPAAIGIDPFSMGPVFIILGIGWLGAASMNILAPDSAFLPLAVMAVLTLWYIPIGAVLSVFVLLVLFWARPF